MLPRMDNRLYTNLVLTVIAAMLVLGAAREYGVAFLPSAQAQLKNQADDLRRTATGVPVDNTIPQTQDVAVASATSDVAASNREIAAAIHDLAEAVRDGLSGLQTGLARSTNSAAPAAAGSAAPSASSGSSASSGNKPTIEVTR